eukprot:7728168-Alexandrium_andersonii.AAC.1
MEGQADAVERPAHDSAPEPEDIRVPCGGAAPASGDAGPGEDGPWDGQADAARCLVLEPAHQPDGLRAPCGDAAP